MSDRVLGAALTRRSIVKLSLAASAVAALPLTLRGAAAQDPITVTMVTDTAGLGDQNFNDLADRAGKQAATDLGIEWKVIESADAAAYEPNLIAAAEQSDLVVGVGFKLTDAMTVAAEQFPDVKFMIIDAVSDAPNVRGVLFKENEGAFLTGIVAGLMTDTNKIGIIGGERIPPVVRYEVGFVAGVETVNPDAEVSIVYADTFGDPAQGKQIAEDMYGQGIDIVFPIAGATGTGAYQAAAEKGDGAWLIGVDVTQEHLAPGHEIVTDRKGVDTSVYEGIKSVVDGNFVPGPVSLGIKEGGVGVLDEYQRIPAEVWALAMAAQQAVIDGTIVPPADDDQLKAFVVPDLSTLPAATPSA